MPMGIIKNTASSFIETAKAVNGYIGTAPSMTGVKRTRDRIMTGARVSKIMSGAYGLSDTHAALAPAVAGGAAGGIYGMFSDDTSVIGGAFKGALAGGAIGAGVNYGIGRKAMKAYKSEIKAAQAAGYA